MVTLYDVPTEDLIDEVADRLADRIEEPEWSSFVTTGVDRELPPQQDDFWYVRAASLLRKVADRGPVGVGTLAADYGGATRERVEPDFAPPSHVDGSRNIVRTILQDLESEGLVETAQGEGRRITDEGRSFLDDVAGDVMADLDRPELERYA